MAALEGRDTNGDEPCRITEAQKVLTSNSMTAEIKVNNSNGRYNLYIRGTLYIYAGEKMDVKKSTVAINHPETQAITLTIGKLIVNFGALEYESYLWLACLKGCINGIDNSGLFKSRVDRLLKNLAQLSHAQGNDAVEAWNSALEIAKFRNRIAHNAIIFGWNKKDEVGPPDFLVVLDVKVGLNNGDKEAVVLHSEIKQQVNGIETLVQELRQIRCLI